MTKLKTMLNNALLLLGVSWLAMFLCACAPSDTTPLGRRIAPVSQEIALDIDADRDGYTGKVAIELKVLEKTDTIGFHASKMDLESVVLQGPDGPIELDCTVGNKGLTTARLPAPLARGRYTLKIEFSREFGRKGVGIYKIQHRGAPYVFTQFEPEHAREAFPCFDAPEFKINWRMILKTPRDHLAISNTPPKRVTTSPESKTVRFMRTRPMPSYLLAIAVGPMETLPVEGMSAPGRIVTARGQKHLAESARRISPPLLKALEDYFQCPYPYAKLDQIAVPEFMWGGMENAGAITYSDSVLLMDPKTATASQRKRQATVIAHEMAHMWFGNLVTPKWWDDLWLNESFASWITLKVLRDVHPELDLSSSDIASRERAMGSDSLASTRAIRRKVHVDENMTRLFNSLAYNKGMAILTMVEDWLGEESFRQGMIHYMTQHRWGNADAFDLAAALSRVDDSDINAIMKDFVTLPGVPAVSLEFIDAKTVRLTQRRYKLFGARGGDGRTWNIPVILRYSDGRKEYTQRVLMTGAVAEVKLKASILRKVDGWIYPNADEKGYYRWALERGELTRLAQIVQTRFDTRRKLGFLGNVSALFYAGDIPADDFLTIVGPFSLDESPEVVSKVAQVLDEIHANFVTHDLGDSYAKYLRTVLGKSLQKIGLSEGKSESVHTAPLRARLIGLLGEKGGDAELMKLARTRAASYVKDPHSVDPSLAGVFLKLSAITGDAKLFDKYAGKFETVKDPTERTHYIDALSNFRAPELMDKALDYAMNGPVKPNRVSAMILGQARDEAGRRRVFDWVIANYDAIRKRVPAHSMPYYAWIANGRSTQLLKEARRFFLDKRYYARGVKDTLRKVTDSVNLRARLNKTQRKNIIRFLDKHHQSTSRTPTSSPRPEAATTQP